MNWSRMLRDASNKHPLDVSGLEGPGAAGARRPGSRTAASARGRLRSQVEGWFLTAELLLTLQPEAVLLFHPREVKTSRKTCCCRRIPSVALSRILDLKILVLPDIKWVFLSWCTAPLRSFYFRKVTQFTAYNPISLIKSNPKKALCSGSDFGLPVTLLKRRLH